MSMRNTESGVLDWYASVELTLETPRINRNFLLVELTIDKIAFSDHRGIRFTQQSFCTEISFSTFLIHAPECRDNITCS